LNTRFCFTIADAQLHL